MKITRNSIQTTLSSVAIKSSGLVLLFAATHTVSDAIINMLSALLPTLQSRFALTETTLALLIATLSLSVLVTQPFFGALADRVGYPRVAAVGVILNVVLFSLIGLVQDSYFLFALILVGGLGSAALHPTIASMARLAGGNKPEFAVSLFSAGGTLGLAIGPLIIMLLLVNLSLSFTPWLMMLIVLAQDLSPHTAGTAAGMMMGFSAGVAGLVYVGIGILHKSIGLAPAMMVGYLGLFLAAVVAWATIDPRKAVDDERLVDNLSSLCSPCVDQNIAVYPQRTNAR